MNTPITDLVTRMFVDGMPPAAIVAAVREAELGKLSDIHQDFAEFWQLYPAKIGKGDAEKAYMQARRLVSAQILLDGVQRYAAKRDDRPWCHAGTWLRQRRWEDQEVPRVMRNGGLGDSFILAAMQAKEHENAALGTDDLFGGPVRRISGR
jgi:hypothetical protein